VKLSDFQQDKVAAQVI